MRTLRTLFVIAALLCGLSALADGPTPPVDPSAKLLQQAALMLLREGNARYIAGKTQHPNLDAERRTNTVAQGQEPFATILACSDSREPVELIFDRGVGDLFVVRVAGNVAGTSELATAEYGIGHLHTPVLVVMGHTRCGAVTAVVKGAEVHGHFFALAEKIKPAADKAKAETSNADEAISRAIEANVWQTISAILKQSSIVREQVAAGRVQVVGAIYDLEAGKVKWLGSHPEQEILLVVAPEPVKAPAPTEPTPANPAAPKPPRVELPAGNLLPVAKSDTPALLETHAPGPIKPSGAQGH
jgi:carbonic anhydrase